MQLMGFLFVGLVLVCEALSARTVLMEAPNPGFGGDESAGAPLTVNSGGISAGAVSDGVMISPPGGFGMDSNSDSLLDSTPLWTPILLRKIIQQIHRQQQQLQMQEQQYPNNKRSKNFYQQCAFNAVSCFG